MFPVPGRGSVASTHEGENCENDCSRLIREEQKFRGRVSLCLAGGLQGSALYKFNGEAETTDFWSCFLLKASSDGQTIQSDGECSERTANAWDTTSKPRVVESETR